jgi:Zn-dependent metalloprotease
MRRCCPVNCIVPPYILRRLMQSDNAEYRRIALETMLATVHLRAERRLTQFNGIARSLAGEKRRTVFDCKHGTRPAQAKIVREEGKAAVKDRPVNDAFDGLGLTYDFFFQVFGRNSVDGNGMRLDGYVHYGRAYNNAFWDGREMIFGDGDGKLFMDFTGALDVIAHELGHGVTQFTAGLEYHDQPGALNESMSDVFGSMVKQWALGQDAAQADWLIGDRIFTPKVKGDALRSMKAPGTAYDDPDMGRDPQPAHMDHYQQLPDTDEGDWGGVHVNSGIPNRAFYLMATALGGKSWEHAGRIWFEALKQSQPTTDFAAFARNTVLHARNTYGASSAQARAAQAAWKGVGIAVKTR